MIGPRRLLSIKKVTVQRKLSVKLDFTLPKGEHSLRLSFISDSHIGADQVRSRAPRVQNPLSNAQSPTGTRNSADFGRRGGGQ